MATPLSIANKFKKSFEQILPSIEVSANSTTFSQNGTRVKIERLPLNSQGNRTVRIR